jgi:hypothetical protein
MAPILSIEEQMAAMKATWQGLGPRNIDRRLQSVRWVGRVRAQYCWYTIEIRYRVGSMPEVRVLAPTLVRLPGNKEGALPHVYPPADDPTLCLFDPRTSEWDTSMPLAQTIVLWTFDWLSCYELWLMTGKWTGGGRHACDPVPISMENLQ